MCSAVIDQLVSQVRGYDFAVLALVREDPRRSALTPCDQLFTCVLPAYVAHTVCLSACVCHALRVGDAKSLHTLLIVQLVDAQSLENCTTDRASGHLHGPREQQAAEEVLVRSDHPARCRATKRLTSCPQLTSHDRMLDDASSSSGIKPKKKKDARKP